MKLPYSNEELASWIFKISEEFYELAYNDPWFGRIFRNIKQDVITRQQTDFMTQSMGGPKNYGGRAPQDAHPQIWIDEEIWDYREGLLHQAMDKVSAPEDIQKAWFRIDDAFKAAIVNRGGPETCKGRYRMDEIIVEPMPQHLKKKKAA